MLGNKSGYFMREKFISTNELANDASKILKNLKDGEGTVVLRYSDPVGVLISYEDYKKLNSMEQNFVQECKHCLMEAKKVK
jgi:prevent-host-death family protein